MNTSRATGIALRIATGAILFVGAAASSAVAQSPDWHVNPSEFESSMSIAAVVVIDGVESADPGDIVAAFAGEEVRGVAAAVSTGSGWRFFLTVYADGSGEEITFRVFVASQDRMFDLVEQGTFVANGIFGTVSDPFRLTTTTLGGCSSERPDWSIHPPDFESNMSVTADVSFEDRTTSDPGDLLAAFVGNEIRGVAGPTTTASGQAFFLTVYANASGEEVSFAAYDAVRDLVIPMTESLIFVPNAIHGNPSSPFTMSSSCLQTSVEANSPNSFTNGHVSVYPNPFGGKITIEIDVAQPGPLRVEVFDVMGRRQWLTSTGYLQAGTHRVSVESSGLASGVYLYRVTQGAYSHVGKLSVTR